MLLDAKLVDGRELEHTEVDQRDLLADEEMPQIAGEEVVADREGPAHSVDRDHRGLLLAAVRAIFEHRHLDVQQLPLSARELLALDHLKAAVDGRDQQLGQFVYASDRRDMLEQSLAVLQPNLVHGDPAQLAEMQWVFQEMTERVGELRHKLSGLDDAQDELMDANREVGKVEGSDAADDGTTPTPKPKPKPAAAAAATATATKPEGTTLTGPELAPAKKLPTTLVGPELPPAKNVPTTLVGPEIPAEKKGPTTLVGPELPVAKKFPSTLGDV